MDNDAIRPLWIMESPNHSGMSVANRNLAAGMIRCGCRPEIFALRDGENAADFEMVGAPVSIFPHMGSTFIGGTALRDAGQLEVNLVHALSAAMLKRAEKVAKKLDVPLLVTCNRLDEEEIRTLAGSSAPGVVSVSRALP